MSDADEVFALRQCVSDLQEQVRSLAERLEQIAGPDVTEPHPPRLLGRRGAIRAGLAAVAAAAGAVLFPKRAVADTSAGTTLRSNMLFGATEIAPQPLDSAISWRRNDPATDPPPGGYVRSVLSLQQEGHGQNSYPWTLFVKTVATDTPGATQKSANTYGVNARLINPGSGHSASVFSDLQHGANASGESLGYDCEIIRSSPHGRVIGLNLLNVGDPDAAAATANDADQAVNIQTTQNLGVRRGFKTGILFEHITAEATATTAGERGIWLKSTFGIGLDMEDNNIKLNRGAKIFFDENQTLYLWLNPDNTRLEFRYLNNVLGYLPLNATPHLL